MTLKGLLCATALPLLFFSSNLCAQTRQVWGIVVDSAGAPVAHASVVAQGTTGTETAKDGTFNLTLPDGVNTLTVSSVGFVSQNVTVGTGLIQVVLQRSSAALSDVVVIGYGSQRRRDLTGSITSITEKDFQTGVITTPEQLIAGKVAGVQITSTGGAPGANSRILIRGGASLNASNAPLIVIDGVPLGSGDVSGTSNPLSLINPNDIESFNILKDAAATAIYGSRASNGVIIITTKKGRRGKPMVGFNTQLSAAQNTKKVEVLSADEFRNIIKARGNEPQKALLGTANTNWQDEIYRTAITTDNNVSVSGSIKNTPYRLSVGYLNQQGVLKTGYMRRGSATLNISPQFFDNHLRVDISVKGALIHNRFASETAIGNAVIFDPTQPVYSGSKRFGGFYEWMTGSLPNSNAPRNPVAQLEQREDKSDVKRSIGNVQLDYRFHFLPELRANLNLGYDIAKGEGTVLVPDSVAVDYVRGGRFNEYRQDRNNKLLEFYLNYTKDIGSIDSRIDVTAGYSYNDFLTTVYNFADYTAKREKIPNTDPQFPFNKPQNTLISFFGRLNYGYKNRYLFTASLRHDGSSRFAPDYRWASFPAAAFAWRIREESFLKNTTAVSDLKLRLGYGITGQQEGIGDYDYISYYSLSNNQAQYQLGDTYYHMYRPGGYYARRKWEQTATYNIGIDYGFFSNRINGSVDVYYKKTTDLLNLISQPAGTNFSNQIVANVGDMENKGIEFTLNTTPIRHDKFSWDANFNFTYNKNKITKLTIAPDPNYPGNQFGSIAGGVGNTVQIHSAGYARGAFYVYQQVYDEAGKPLENIFVDQNGDGTINEKDLYRYKNFDPRYLLGFSTNLSYRKWTAGFVLRANLNNYVYNNVYSNLGRFITVVGSSGVLNNASISYLETGFAGGTIQQLLSDYYVQNASFLRMDNFNLAYNAGKVFGKANLRLNATVQNVFVITKYKGLDPELANGIDNNFYPRPRTYAIGLGIDF